MSERLTPVRLLRVLSRLARWATTLLLLAAIVSCVGWAALRWIIVPRVDEFRPMLQTRVSTLLGIPVRIAAIRAHATGLFPAFELTAVELLDPQGRPGLTLPRVLVSLSPLSVWRLGFEQIYLDNPVLEIRRNRDGSLRVGGLDFRASSNNPDAALDWILGQPEFAIHQGSVRWHDEQRGAPPLTLRDVELVLRNTGRQHAARLDATPDTAWGDRWTLRARMQHPLWADHNGQWRDWSGTLYADLPRVDLSELRRYVDVGVELTQGRGAMRAWVDVTRGQIVGAAADLAVTAVSARLAPELPVLDMESVHGRIGVRRHDGTLELLARDLRFDTHDGLRWPGGTAQLSLTDATDKHPARGQLVADKLDLSALNQIAQRLPLSTELRSTLSAHAPRGLVQAVRLQWEGDVRRPARYSAQGAIQGLALQATDRIPGITGADLRIEADQNGGNADLQIAAGSITVPHVWEDPLLPVTRLSSRVSWRMKDDRLSLNVSGLQLANQDAEGRGSVSWDGPFPGTKAAAAGDMGKLDLQLDLTRADGARVHRYLPQNIPAQARHYVRDAVLAGHVNKASFKVQGELRHFPFERPQDGEFHIKAEVRDVRYAYVPSTIQPSDALPWPTLEQLDGELIFDRRSLSVRNARGRFGTRNALQVIRADATIADLNHSLVEVSANLRGALPDALIQVDGSPLAQLTSNALKRAKGSGNTDISLKLNLPVASIARSTVRGTVTLASNDLQMTPDSPRMSRLRGNVQFTEHGFELQGVQGRMLGGDVRLEGGLAPSQGRSGSSGLLLRANGTATAEGMQQARELGLLARLATYSSGTTTYAATLGLRSGEPELLITSSLEGLALRLPSPLNKPADATLPLRVATTVSPVATPQAPLQDTLSVELGRVAAVSYQRDLTGVAPTVRRGVITMGLADQEHAPYSADGVTANIHAPQLDLDAWDEVLTRTGGTSSSAFTLSGPSASYIPTQWVLRSDDIKLGGRHLHHVVVGGTRENAQWRANIAADEANGYLEYRQGHGNTPGRVYARLSKLVIAPSAAGDVETLLDAQPAAIPALDVVAQDFELRGKALGRLEIDAINRGVTSGGREWRLNAFNIVNAEGTLHASGNWATLGSSVPGGTRGSPERRRTVLNFKLDVVDGGALLARLGMKDVVRRSQGKLEGQVAWVGSPITVDFETLTGHFNVSIDNGQFLKADPGISKLLGVLSLQSLPRRLILDFRDVFSDGFAFDTVRGDVDIDQGVARTSNLQMKGVNAAVLMDGSANLEHETQDLRVVVIPDLNAGAASLLASMVNPAVGLGTFLAQLFLRRPLSDATTQEFRIDGTWADPRVTKVERAP